jgi:hypothetical protein
MHETERVFAVKAFLVPFFAPKKGQEEKHNNQVKIPV